METTMPMTQFVNEGTKVIQGFQHWREPEKLTPEEYFLLYEMPKTKEQTKEKE